VAPGWDGWIFDDEGYLKDPAGNKYLPADLQASFYARKAWESRAGYPGEIKYLREHLKALVNEARSQVAPVFVVKVERMTVDGPQLLQTMRLGG
jgi:hypothetical protein